MKKTKEKGEQKMSKTLMAVHTHTHTQGNLIKNVGVAWHATLGINVYKTDQLII